MQLGRGRTVKGAHHAQNSRRAEVGNGLKRIFRIRVTLPFNLILHNTIHNALADNGLNNILGLTVDNLDRGLSVEFAGQRERIVVVALEFGDMKHGVDLHGGRKVEFVGDRGDNLGNTPGPLVLQAKLG